MCPVDSSHKGPIRIGVVGAGKAHNATFHGPALKSYAQQHADTVELAAVCDLNEQKANEYAAAFGFAKTYTSIEAMLAKEELHGIVAITPVAVTETVAAELMPAGIPFILEKPPGKDSASTQRLLELYRKHKTPHMISFNRRFNPAILKAREWLSSVVGERPIQMVSGRMMRNRRREPQFAVGTGIHLIDTVLSFSGMPQSVATRRMDTPWPDCYSFSSSLVSSAGASISISIAPSCGVVEETYEIIGPDYSVRIDVENPAVRVMDGGRLSLQWAMPGDVPKRNREGTAQETEYFLKGLRNGVPFHPNLEDGLVSMLVAEAIQAGKNQSFSLDFLSR